MKESDLINSIIIGDERAFKLFVENYAEMVFRVIMNFGISTEDTEDLSQEVFIDAYKNLNKFRKNSEISTWLYRIAINKSLNFVRKKKQTIWLKKYDISKHNDNGRYNIDNNIYEESCETKYVNNEQKMILYNHIDKLSKNQRIAFTLNKLDNLSYKEISEIMNISVSSVESLIHRAKKNLQTKLLNFFK